MDETPQQTESGPTKPEPSRVTFPSRAFAAAKAFLKKVWEELEKNIIKSIVVVLLAVITAIGVFLWRPIEDFLLDLRDINAEEARTIVRTQVGGQAVWATPFHNPGDPLQYIVTWVPSEDSSGALDAHLLSGSGERYSDRNLQVPAVPGYLFIEAARDETNSALRVLNTAVTDWNRDGWKEVLGITDLDAATAASHTFQATLYDTRSAKTASLTARQDMTTRTETFADKDNDPALRIWLSKRLDEYLDHNWTEGCRRTRAGVLKCPKAAAPAPVETIQARVKPAGAKPAEEPFERRDRLNQQWLADNSRTFTQGALRLTFVDGLSPPTNEGETCAVDDRYQLINYFKSSLALNDLKLKKSAALYVQDGRHHREIPTIIVGREFLWLALSVRSQILAIRRADWTVVAFDVELWRGDSRLTGKALDSSGETAPEDERTKESQLDGLKLEGGKLVYPIDEQDAVLVPVGAPKDEFAKAHACGLAS